MLAFRETSGSSLSLLYRGIHALYKLIWMTEQKMMMDEWNTMLAQQRHIAISQRQGQRITQLLREAIQTGPTRRSSRTADNIAAHADPPRPGQKEDTHRGRPPTPQTDGRERFTVLIRACTPPSEDG